MLHPIRPVVLLAALLAASACGSSRAGSAAADTAQGANIGYATLDPSLKQLRDDFNAHVGEVRLVYIVGATCPGCLRGMDDLGRALSGQQDNPRLHTFVVYVPALGAKAKDIQATLYLIPGKQVSRYWDPAGVSGTRFRDTLGIGVYAWDVWMIYGRGQRWEQDLPPPPDYWMHQLYGVPMSKYLNADTFARQVETYLAQTKTVPGNTAAKSATGAP